jgi:site-specific DNA-methyltransferase (adenine-specific)
VDVIFADPPYFLSGSGSTCSGGKRASVVKGEWDRPKTLAEMHAWNGKWLAVARRLLAPNGTIWVSGTLHSIHSCGIAMQQLGMAMINEVIWQKTNPPPNLACRCITHSHETLLWAKRAESSKHHFDYAASRRYTGKQLLDVWKMGSPGKAELVHGKHPTQKPIALVARCLAISAPDGATVLDPFQGSGTTGVVVAGLDSLAMRYVGIDSDPQWLSVTEARIVDELGDRPAPDDISKLAPRSRVRA